MSAKDRIITFVVLLLCAAVAVPLWAIDDKRTSYVGGTMTSFTEVCDGTCPTWGQAADAGDLGVEEVIEVDGIAYLDGGAEVGGVQYMGGNSLCLGDNHEACMVLGGSDELHTYIDQTERIEVGDDGKQVLTIGLDDATGNETAYALNYTVNKASSGDDIGLHINRTDTASPGTSYGLVVGNYVFYTLPNGSFYSAANATLAGTLTLNSGGTIATSSNGDLTLDAHGTGVTHMLDGVCVGDGTCSASGLTLGQGHLLVEGNIESQANIYSRAMFIANDYKINFMTSGYYSSVGAQIYVNTDDGLHLKSSTVGRGNGNFIFHNQADVDFDHDTLAAHPTIYFQSSTNPDEDNTQWGAVYHDGSSGSSTGNLTLVTGAGGIKLDPASSASTILLDGVVQVAAYTRSVDIGAGVASVGATAPTPTTIGTARCLAFDADAEVAFFHFDVPDDWTGTSDMTLKVFWCAEAGDQIQDTEDVKFDATYRSLDYDTGEAYDNGSTTLATASYTSSGATADKLCRETEITLDYDDGDNALTKGEVLQIQFDRDVSGESNSYSGDAQVCGWAIEFTSNGLAEH